MIRDNQVSDNLNRDRDGGFLDGFAERPMMAAAAGRAGIN